MSDKSRNDEEQELAQNPSDSKAGVTLTPAGEVMVSHEEKAARPGQDKRIHRRRPLPPVPEKRAERESGPKN